MTIESIQSVHRSNDGSVYVSAFVADMVTVFAASFYDPPEYGPALCEASFEIDEDEVLPEDDDELINYLEERDLEWQVIDISDY